MHRELEDLVPYCPKCGYNLTGLKEHRCPECGTPFDPIALLRGQLASPKLKKLSVPSLIGSIFASVFVVWVALEWFGQPGLLILVALFPAWLIYYGRPEKARLQAGMPGYVRRIIIDKFILVLASLAIVIAIICVTFWCLFRGVHFTLPWL